MGFEQGCGSKPSTLNPEALDAVSSDLSESRRQGVSAIGLPNSGLRLTSIRPFE